MVGALVVRSRPGERERSEPSVEALDVVRALVVKQRGHFGGAGKNPMTTKRAARAMKLEIDGWLGARTILFRM